MLNEGAYSLLEDYFRRHPALAATLILLQISIIKVLSYFYISFGDDKLKCILCSLKSIKVPSVHG
jgi:hypothetical protein